MTARLSGSGPAGAAAANFKLKQSDDDSDLSPSPGTRVLVSPSGWVLRWQDRVRQTCILGEEGQRRSAEIRRIQLAG